MNEDNHDIKIRPVLYMGIFFTTLSVIIFEISLTKIFSVTLWYHFAYFVVSTALFGLGAGGLASFFARDYLMKRLKESFMVFSVLQFFSIVLGIFIIMNFDIKIYLTVASLFNLALIYILCSVPFTFAGIILSLAFRGFYKDTHKIYFVDLLGSATGCLVFLAAITYISGPSVVLLSGFASAAAFMCFGFLGPGRFPLKTAVVVLLTTGAIIYSINATEIFTLKYTKTYRERKDMEFEKWSPLARITVYPTIFWLDDGNQQFGWGLSKMYKGTEPIKQRWIEQDASAGTPITNFDGDISKLDFLKYDITSIAYRLKHAPRTFIIGAGGGRDVLTALYYKSPLVVACDINPVTMWLVQEKYKDFAGNLYGRSDVRPVVAEARNYIRGSDETFDIIQISLIDSWAATAAGAFALAENSLYTVEAFRDYLDHLTDDGMLSISRYIFMPRNQTLRVVVLARKALEEMGVANPGDHIAVVGTSYDTEGVSTVVVKKTPFTSEEIASITESARSLQFEIIYLPGTARDHVFDNALHIKPLKAFTDQYPYNVHPPTDDKPFFFQMVYFSDAIDLMLHKKKYTGQTFNYYAVSIILTLILISALLTGAFYVLPLAISSKAEPLSRSWGIYFILLGLGFMFVEIPLIQKGSLYLGHPTYSLSVVLFSMLVFTGLGSYWSGSFKDEGLDTRLSRILLAAFVLIIILTFFMEWMMPATIGLPLFVKAMLTIGVNGIMAFAMGTAFPTGIKLLSRSHSNAIPWVWALNGGASVMGSIIAMALSMGHGYRFTLMVGATLYLAASFIIKLSTRSAAIEPQPVK